jgi:hypothetical protein
MKLNVDFNTRELCYVANMWCMYSYIALPTISDIVRRTDMVGN